MKQNGIKLSTAQRKELERYSSAQREINQAGANHTVTGHIEKLQSSEV